MLEETAKSLSDFKNKTKVLCIAADLKLEKDTENLYAEIKATFGRPPDIVIANAGWVSEQKPLAEESISTW